MKILQRRRVGLFTRGAQKLFLVGSDGCLDVHGRSSRVGSSERLGGDADRQGLVTLHEAGIHPLRLADHLNIVVPLEDLFPDDLEWKLRKPDSDAAMDAETERDVGARTRAINDEFVG